MAGTRRTPLARRPALARITPAALEAFRRLRVLEAQCTCLPDGPPIRLCVACDEWWAQQSTISHELALKPWLWPAVEHEGTGEWRPNEEARALWRLFEEAASGHVAAVASARAEPKLPSRPPKKKPPRSARAVANSGRSFAQLRSRRKQQGAPVVGSFD